MKEGLNVNRKKRAYWLELNEVRKRAHEGSTNVDLTLLSAHLPHQVIVKRNHGYKRLLQKCVSNIRIIHEISRIIS